MQPFPDRRHACPDDHGAGHDKNTCERHEPRSLHSGCRHWKHDGKDDGSHDKAVGIHVPREPATLHATSLPSGQRLDALIAPLCRYLAAPASKHFSALTVGPGVAAGRRGALPAVRCDQPTWARRGPAIWGTQVRSVTCDNPS